MSWLNDLDKRLPYLVTSKHGTGTSHTMALFNYAGQWYVYNNLTPVKDSYGRWAGTQPRVEAVTEPIFDRRTNAWKRDRLTHYGQALFYGPDDRWGIAATDQRFVVYSPVDKTRLAVLRAYLNVARQPGETPESAIDQLIRKSGAFKDYQPEREGS